MFKCVRWDLVSEKYDGIEFSPYHYKIADNLNWYKSISINSGCIWNAKAIISLNLVAYVYSQKHDHLKNRWKLTDYGEFLLNNSSR